MSEVTLRIAGKAYKVACADGEEAQLARLGSMIDEKLNQLQGNLAGTEAQNLLFAALFLADELHETREALGEDPRDLASKLQALEEGAENAEKKTRELSLELNALRAERDAIANDLANMKSAASGQEPLFASDNVSSKLEQLADLIEKCADTLEAQAATH